jgi:hypothetical protein
VSYSVTLDPLFAAMARQLRGAAKDRTATGHCSSDGCIEAGQALNWDEETKS